jgi:two-component system, OmpR family, phosphate regulon response regulator PhoB
MRALIIEDDRMIRRLVEVQLSKESIDVTVAPDATAGRAALQGAQFDLLILDLTLPDGSGLDMLKALRQGGSTTHVIVVSGAVREVDRVRALQYGADDYVSKPFFARELAARVLAVRRRLERSHQSHLQYNGLEFDLEARKVTAGGSEVDLTTKEFDLIAYVACRPGQVFSREELLQSVWQSTSAWQRPSTVTEHVRRLRAKLGDGTPPRLLVSVRSIGYRFDPPYLSEEQGLAAMTSQAG